jgi:hypothetical protein
LNLHRPTVHQAALPQAGRERPVERTRQPGRAVADPQQRRAQAAGDQFAEEAGPGVVALVGAGCQRQQHRAALSGDAPGGKHRLGRRPWMHPKMRAVQEQVLQLDPAKIAGLPGVEVVLDRLAGAADGRLRQGGLRAQHLAHGGLHVTGRQATHEPRDDQGFQRVGARHALAKQP